jgi:hypothetical protein
MKYQQEKNDISTKTMANNLTFLSNLVPAKIQAPFSLFIINNPNYHFCQLYTCHM